MGRAAAAAIVISACRATPTTPPPPNACAGTCSAIELAEMNGGKMDKYVTAGCGDRRNFALVAPGLVQPYRDLAARYALADRWFQPIAGQTVSNDMYFARAQFVFLDNAFNAPAVGAQCSEIVNKASFPGPSIGDLLTQAGVAWASYGEGYATMVAA